METFVHPERFFDYAYSI